MRSYADKLRMTIIWSVVLLSMLLYGARESFASISIEGEDIPGVQVMDVQGASGAHIGRLGASIPPWQWVTVDLGTELPSGQYKVSFRTWGAGDTSADTLFYWLNKDGDQLPQNGLAVQRFSDKAFHDYEVVFRADTGFRTVVLKHGPEQGCAGVVIDWLKIESAPYSTPLHISAYRRVMGLPHISGIDTSVMKNELDLADTDAREGNPSYEKRIAHVEGWMEALAGLTDVDQQIRYLMDMAKIRELNLQPFSASIGQAYQRSAEIKRLLNSGNVDQASAGLKRLSGDVDRIGARIGKHVGGQIWPDRQRDPFTWLNSPVLQGFAIHGLGTNASAGDIKTAFSSEPTPFICSWVDGPEVRLVPTDTQFSVDRSWTGAVWHSGKFTMQVSTFSPAVRIAGLREFSVDDVTGVDRASDGRSVVLKCKSWSLLVHGAKIRAELVSGRARVCMYGASSAWLVPIRDARESQSWQRVLPRIPEGVVQVLSGNIVTQYFTGSNKQIAPIPPMLQFALTRSSDKSPKLNSKKRILLVGGSWGKLVRAGQFDFQLPFAYIDNSSKLSYVLPRFSGYPLAGRRGINVWADRTTPQDISLLRREGANYIRLVLIEGPGKDGFDVWFDAIKPILDSCRESRIKVNLDAHFNRNVSDDYLADFWPKLVRACSGYRDVIGAYDLLNEPSASSPAENDNWYKWVEKTSASIRSIDPDTPILLETGRGANPTGFPLMPEFKAENVIYGFHLYYPHSFTHQAMLYKQGSPESAPIKTYPAWAPIINWSDESWNESVEWWDRWTLRGQCLPIFRWWIEHGFPPMDNGEFGVIGYPQNRIPGSVERWTRDVMTLNEALQSSWALYGYHGGFGWSDAAKPVVREFWKLNK